MPITSGNGRPLVPVDDTVIYACGCVALRKPGEAAPQFCSVHGGEVRERKAAQLLVTGITASVKR